MRELSVDAVVAACRSLPDPAWRRIFDHPEPRMAATLLPVTDVGGQATIVFTKRAGDLDHGGDWVFPGGGVDAADASHAEAARREAAEELGVAIERLEVVGQLATHGPIVTGHVIESYVGVLAAGSTLCPDAGEVSDVALVPIADLLQPDAYWRAPALVVRHIPDELRRGDAPADLSRLRYYRVAHGEYLWGLQADILHELLTHVTRGSHNF
jgi:8-oxo-dGTP pyrophosphatase MutT (NUDIX family)